VQGHEGDQDLGGQDREEHHGSRRRGAGVEQKKQRMVQADHVGSPGEPWTLNGKRKPILNSST